MTVDSLLTGARNGQRLRLDFTWQGDRHQQAVWLVEDEHEICLLTTVEGTGRQTWPPSPPLQNLHLHKMPTGDLAALSVGMAGTSHWSLSVEASADQPTLNFDVACRVKEDPGDLAVTWESLENITVDVTDKLSVELSTNIGCVRIYVEERDELAANLYVAHRSEHSGQRICLSPGKTAGTPPQTMRWRYRIELA